MHPVYHAKITVFTVAQPLGMVGVFSPWGRTAQIAYSSRVCGHCAIELTTAGIDAQRQSFADARTPPLVGDSQAPGQQGSDRGRYGGDPFYDVLSWLFWLNQSSTLSARGRRSKGGRSGHGDIGVGLLFLFGTGHGRYGF
jgi:hypothetical protein